MGIRWFCFGAGFHGTMIYVFIRSIQYKTLQEVTGKTVGVKDLIWARNVTVLSFNISINDLPFIWLRLSVNKLIPDMLRYIPRIVTNLSFNYFTRVRLLCNVTWREEYAFLHIVTPCRNFSNLFLKTTRSVISVHILVLVSMRNIFWIINKYPIQLAPK